MTPHPDQLAALAAVVDEGTFEAAARRLNVTTSAVSQRIRALESAAGQVVVVRATPCRATAAGEALVRLARETALLYAEAAEALEQSRRTRLDLPVAVNADSLASWFRPVLDAAAGWSATALRLWVEDQAWSAGLLRRGDVLAAVTSEPVAVQGCSVEPLGVLRYRPAASPGLVEQHRRGTRLDWSRMPMVVFNEKDDLQHELLRRRGVAEPPLVHRVPTSSDFHEAVRRGLGWGLVPDPQLAPDLDDGRLVLLSTRVHTDVALHWQRWRLQSPALQRLTEAVRVAARAELRRATS